jgi:hydrogenase maturation protein HypF
VAALLGLRQRATYEGQAATELEWAADAGGETTERDYALALKARGDLVELDWEPMLRAILADRAAGVPSAAISRAFHDALSNAIAAVATRIGIKTVVLTGGCFQNARLTEAAAGALNDAGLTPCWPERIPPNDGGLALGQAVWAAQERTRES